MRGLIGAGPVITCYGLHTTGTGLVSCQTLRSIKTSVTRVCTHKSWCEYVLRYTAMETGDITVTRGLNLMTY